jgi:hypothetical protein
LKVIVKAYEAKKAAETAAKAARREQILVEKEKIVAEAGITSPCLKAGRRLAIDLKALLEEWKAAPRLEKKTDAASLEAISQHLATSLISAAAHTLPQLEATQSVRSPMQRSSTRS